MVSSVVITLLRLMRMRLLQHWLDSSYVMGMAQPQTSLGHHADLSLLIQSLDRPTFLQAGVQPQLKSLQATHIPVKLNRAADALS